MSRIVVKYFWKSVVVATIILFLSLYSFSSSMGLEKVKNSDKYIHILMYFGLSAVAFYEYFKSKFSSSRYLYILLFSGITLYGGVIELLQENFTTTRSGEWLDWVADIVGVVVGAIVSTLIFKKQDDRRKT